MSASGPAKTRKHINRPGRKAALPFSDGVLVGDTLYLSGRIGVDPATGMAPADLDEELRLLFDSFEGVLTQAEMSMNDLVWVQVFSPDLSLWGRFNAAYLMRFSGDLPARAFIPCRPLLRGGRFEMMGIAVRR